MAEALAESFAASVDFLYRGLQIEEELGKQSDEALIELGRQAQEHAINSFALQCLISSIIAERREGGLHILAREWGVSYTRVSEMGRVWKTIMRPMIQEKLAIPIELDKEFYHAALRAPEPVQALSYAQEQKAQDKSFSCMKFRKAMALGMPESLRTCRECSAFELVDNVPFTIRFNNMDWSVVGKLGICSKRQAMLVATVHTDLEEEAVRCEDFRVEAVPQTSHAPKQTPPGKVK